MKKIAGIITCLLITSIGMAQNSNELKIGDKIDDFSATASNEKIWNSSTIDTDFLVVYFYPAAMTGGCTKQACAYRDDKAYFDEMNTTVVAISGDEVKNLQYFKEAYQLNFPLLSDIDGQISKLFGVPTKTGGAITREIEGQELILTRGVTTPRWTFVLDKDRKIIYKNSNVNASQDSKNVKEVIENYQKK